MKEIAELEKEYAGFIDSKNRSLWNARIAGLDFRKHFENDIALIKAHSDKVAKVLFDSYAEDKTNGGSLLSMLNPFRALAHYVNNPDAMRKNFLLLTPELFTFVLEKEDTLGTLFTVLKLLAKHNLLFSHETERLSHIPTPTFRYYAAALLCLDKAQLLEPQLYNQLTQYFIDITQTDELIDVEEEEGAAPLSTKAVMEKAVQRAQEFQAAFSTLVLYFHENAKRCAIALSVPDKMPEMASQCISLSKLSSYNYEVMYGLLFYAYGKPAALSELLALSNIADKDRRPKKTEYMEWLNELNWFAKDGVRGPTGTKTFPFTVILLNRLERLGSIFRYRKIENVQEPKARDWAELLEAVLPDLQAQSPKMIFSCDETKFEQLENMNLNERMKRANAEPERIEEEPELKRKRLETGAYKKMNKKGVGGF